jgi:small subunit ribosomal protein S3Ae
MARKKQRKVVDKWKLKKWYTILAPESFDRKEIGETVASDPQYLLNRVVKIPLSDLTGQPTQTSMFTFVKFRIKDVKGETAYTDIIGHELSSTYLKTLVRRKRAVVSVVKDVKTKDGKVVRLKVVAVTDSKVPRNTKRNLHHEIVAELEEASKLPFDQLMQEAIFGKINMRIFNRLKQITAMRRVEVRKSELIEQF